MAFNRETHKFYGEQNESEAKPKDNGLSNLSSSTASPVLNPTQKQLPAYNRFLYYVYSQSLKSAVVFTASDLRSCVGYKN